MCEVIEKDGVGGHEGEGLGGKQRPSHRVAMEKAQDCGSKRAQSVALGSIEKEEANDHSSQILEQIERKRGREQQEGEDDLARHSRRPLDLKTKHPSESDASVSELPNDTAGLSCVFLDRFSCPLPVLG
jgi:hypothetical protein